MPAVPNSTPAANMANLFMADRSFIFLQQLDAANYCL